MLQAYWTLLPVCRLARPERGLRPLEPLARKLGGIGSFLFGMSDELGAVLSRGTSPEAFSFFLFTNLSSTRLMPTDSMSGATANILKELGAERQSHHKVLEWIGYLRSDIENIGTELETDKEKAQHARCRAELREALLLIPVLLEKKVELLFKQRKLGLMRPDRLCTLEVALLEDVMILDEAIMVQPDFLFPETLVLGLSEGSLAGSPCQGPPDFGPVGPQLFGGFACGAPRERRRRLQTGLPPVHLLCPCLMKNTLEKPLS